MSKWVMREFYTTIAAVATAVAGVTWGVVAR
jgi:hypothetical protein